MICQWKNKLKTYTKEKPGEKENSFKIKPEG